MFVKKLIFPASFLIICLSASGRSITNVKSVDISNAAVERIGDSVKVSFDMDVPRQVVGRSYRLTISPVLYNGANSAELTPVHINSRYRDRIDRRAERLSGNRQAQTEAQGIGIPEGTKTRYAAMLPYSSWMEQVSLRTVYTVDGCCNVDVSEGRMILANVMLGTTAPESTIPIATPFLSSIKTELTPLEKLIRNETFLFPSSEYTNINDVLSTKKINGALKIYFRQGRSVIDRNFNNNGHTLERILSAIKIIEDDPKSSLNKVVIAGYASPEGTYDFNTRLSQKRAESLKNYLSNNIHGFKPNLVEIINGSEDWDGLRMMVAASDMQYRQQVLAIIDKVPVMSGREKQLMDLKGGVPYNYMYKNYFSELRNAGYILVYYDREITENERAVSDINRAIDMIRGGNYPQALSLLEPYRNNPMAYNALGVVYNAMGEKMLAREYFNKGSEAGDAEAKANLRVLTK